MTNIPLGKMTAITGVSGSGKSTLLKDILGAYGAKNYTYIATKTVKDSLVITDDVDVEKVENLPQTILIDVKSSISNPLSTVSTVTGIHEILRNLFIDFGNIHCGKCGSKMTRDYSLIQEMMVDLRIDEKFKDAIDFIKERGAIKNIVYFDKTGNITNNEKKKALATVYFSLKIVSEKIVREYNKQFGCSIGVVSQTAESSYDFMNEIECAACHSIEPNLVRSRMSYNTAYETGGGACRCCQGTGKTTKIKAESIFQNKSKGILDGSSPFITAKGIKYSTVTEKFLCSIYDNWGIDITTPIELIPKEFLDVILYGTDKEIEFWDRTGGKKNLRFEGISSYLEKAYRANKGGEILTNLFNESVCNSCGGSRFDQDISNFVFGGESINSLMKMNLSELGDWCSRIEKDVPDKAHRYLDRIIKETDNFKQLSCGHLSLMRQSSTLSGGELQRIRVCTLLNADIHGLCYLLDEPSSGLHYSDIEKLAGLLEKICNQGNTVIMVEHNKKLISYCNYIVDMGPGGGERGGNVLFNTSLNEIKNYSTATARLLRETDTNVQSVKSDIAEDTEFFEFNHLTQHNLKNISVRFPKNFYTAVCGVSGSGKSTFVKDVVFSAINENLGSYGIDEIDYLGQASKVTSSQSTVASLIKIGDYIAKLFEKSSHSKLKYNSFMPGSSEGKCSCCGGKGKIFSAADELLGVCDQCGGYGYDMDVLSIHVDGLNIYEIYNMSLEVVGKHVNDSKIKTIAEISSRLGVGYLTFSRQSKTLSKGELQRVSLIPLLMGNKKNHLLLLDEPSKGLHASDAIHLVESLREITNVGNTVLVVEHNPDMIRNADYIIEFGGTGVDGGYILFQGDPRNIKNTPTAKMLESFELREGERTNEKIKNIVINDSGNTKIYAPFFLYFEKNYAEALLKAAKRAKDDFLSVAIINNAMFSRVDKNVVESDIPIMMEIDFNSKIQYNISVSEALNIRHFLKEIAFEENEEQIARYVFDSNSSTGKCLTCKGSGKTITVDENAFLQNGELNVACKNFLKNNTLYTKISKLIKKDGIDLSKNVDLMSAKERLSLFWGYDTVYNINGNTSRWEGIIPYFIQYHKYYPENSADDIFKKKNEIKCPVCNGERLKVKYLNLKCCGFSYREWMSQPIVFLLNGMKSLESPNIKIIREYLELLCRMGLDNLTLSDELVSMDAIIAEKIKLASIYSNPIYGMGLVVNNLEVLESKDKSIILKMLEDMTEKNTIWVVG